MNTGTWVGTQYRCCMTTWRRRLGLAAHSRQGVRPCTGQNGKMQDRGTLGGTLATVAVLNNGGEVVGQSNLAGDNPRGSRN